MTTPTIPQAAGQSLMWVDVLKLCVPFVFSLALLWAKQAYESRAERRSKSELLWRAIALEAAELSPTLEELDRIATAYGKGRIRVVEIALPPALVTTASRLAELDHRNAHIFVDFVSQATIVIAGLARLGRFTDKAIERGREDLDSLPNAIGALVSSLKRDVFQLALHQLLVLQTLRAGNGRFDAQVIARLETTIQRAQAALSNAPAPAAAPPPTTAAPGTSPAAAP